jgi:hypothetical protein
LRIKGKRDFDYEDWKVVVQAIYGKLGKLRRKQPGKNVRRNPLFADAPDRPMMTSEDQDKHFSDLRTGRTFQ